MRPRVLAPLLAVSVLAACARRAPAPASASASESPSTSAPASPTPNAASAPIASAPPVRREAASDDDAIAEAERAYVDLIVENSPEQATALGLHARDAELDDRTPAGFEAALAREEAMLDRLRARFAAPRASRTKRTDLEIVEHALSVDLRTSRALRPLERRPQTYLDPLNALFLMVARAYAPASSRAHDVVARLEKLPGVVAAAKKNLTTPPRVWTQTAIEDARHAAQFLDETRPFLRDALPDERARADRAVDDAKQAYADYASFLEHDVLPRSTGDFAAGRPLFDFLLHEGYFLDEDADQILAIGQRAFDAIDAEMTRLAKKIDPRAHGWPEVTARLKGNHPTADDLLPSYRRELARARAFLVQKDVVPFPPGDDCEVMATPPFERTTISAAYDAAPPFDGSTTRGFFFVTPVDRSLPRATQEAMLREHDHGDQVDTVVHEAYPGHHLQLSFARRHPSLARKATTTSLFDEGWALYSEELLAELGYYTDEERLIQLEWALVRAARVLVDVGLHTRGMTFEQAVHVLTDRVHLEEPLARSEVKRYTASPTQPLAYLIGRQAIFELRERYRAREGAAFTLKRFHAELLSHGTIPPALIAREMFD